MYFSFIILNEFPAVSICFLSASLRIRVCCLHSCGPPCEGRISGRVILQTLRLRRLRSLKNRAFFYTSCFEILRDYSFMFYKFSFLVLSSYQPNTAAGSL